MTHTSGVLAWSLPAGIATSDISFISLWTLVSALIISTIGLVTLKLLAGRSVRVMVTGVVLVSVATSMAGVAVIAYRMLSGVNQDVVLDLMAIAGLAGLIVALVVGRQLIKASRAISSAVQGVGDSGVYIAPQRTLPAELAELSGALTEAYDRLAQARSRERALEASRRELVAWVSHDLRTPLAGLRAMAEALEDQVVVDPREVSQYHTQIRREVDRLTLMIDDLFELSRIHAGALRLSRRMVGLEDVVAEVVASAEPVARAKGVRLTGAAVRGMPVFIDTAEMGRALRNLVTNAIRHTPSDGVVDVLAEVQSGMACVSVSDACGGIPPADLPRVFDVAFRGESARTPGPQEGAGLGLSIARGIVEAHSGQIAVRNAGPGCQFLIRLPLARPGVPGAPAMSRAGPEPPGPPAATPAPAAPPSPPTNRRSVLRTLIGLAFPARRCRRSPPPPPLVRRLTVHSRPARVIRAVLRRALLCLRHLRQRAGLACPGTALTGSSPGTGCSSSFPYLTAPCGGPPRSRRASRHPTRPPSAWPSSPHCSVPRRRQRPCCGPPPQCAR